MSDHFDKNDHENLERSASPRKKNRCASCCKRFWWVFLIVLIIIALVVVLPVIFVGYPRIARKNVEDSTLTVKSLEISNPNPEGFHINMVQSIGTKSMFHPVFDAFPVNISLPGSNQPFLIIDFPKVKIHDNVEATVDQDVKLPSVEAFTDYSVAVMKNEELTMEARGKTALRQGKLQKVSVDYFKTTVVKGLNHLKGFNVKNSKLIAPPLPDGSNLRGDVLIPNPGVMTLAMGNITMDLSVDGTAIGNSTIKNLVLRPGDNNLEMTAQVDQAKVLGFIAGQNAKYTNGILPIDIAGKSSEYNGKQIPYFSKALQSNKLRVELDVKALLSGGL